MVGTTCFVVVNLRPLFVRQSLFFKKKVALSRMVRVAKLNANRDFWTDAFSYFSKYNLQLLGLGRIGAQGGFNK